MNQYLMQQYIRTPEQVRDLVLENEALKKRVSELESVLGAVPAPQAVEDKAKPQWYGDDPGYGVMEDPEVELQQK